MKIKVLCFIASANYSGATRFSMDVLKLWNKNLFDIRVIFSRYDDKKLSVISAELERLGVKFTVLNKVIPSRGVIWNKCVRRLDGILLRFPQKSIVRFKLKRICSDFKPDLIYSNSVSLPLADLRKYTGKTKVFYYVHLFPSAVSDPAKLTEAHIQKLNASDKIVVASSTVRNLLIERGLKRDLLTVSAESLLPPVKDLAARKIYRNRLGYTENQVVVGGSGAVSYRKGCDLFVEMARRVSSDLKNDQIQFLWIGGGSFEKLAEEPGCTGSVSEHLSSLGRRFKCVGAVDNPHDYYNALDVFVLSSRSDNASLAMLENMSLEKPVIAFRKSGIPEEALSSHGCPLVEHGNIEELVRAVTCLASDAEARQKLGRVLRQWVLENYDLRKNKGVLETLLLECVSAPRP